MKKILVLVSVLLLYTHAAKGDCLYISDVSIIPPDPNATDNITINVEGWTAFIPWSKDGSLFNQSGNDLELFISGSCGNFTAVDYWDHSEEIGTLD